MTLGYARLDKCALRRRDSIRPLCARLTGTSASGMKIIETLRLCGNPKMKKFGSISDRRVSPIAVTMYTTNGANMISTLQRSTRKIKRSFSISPESDTFIRKTQKERKSRSESETLDELLRELMALRQQHLIEDAYTNYYDMLTEEEAGEQHAWGAFAETQLSEGVR